MSYRGWVLVAVGLFATGIVLGLMVPDNLDSVFTEDVAVLEQLAEILGPFKLSTAGFIFLKNVSALLFSFTFSPLLCLAPVTALIANGGLLSFVSVTFVKQESLGLLLAGLLPHGVFELPALIIGEAAALSFGAMAIIALISKERRSQLAPNLKQNIRYMTLAFALLLPAAIIETYITPLFFA